MKNSSSLFLVLLLVGLSLFTGCAATEPRLIGTWKSNRELTLASIPGRKKLKPKQRAFFDNLFGRLTLTYTRRSLTSIMPARHSDEEDSVQKGRYKVIASTPDSVTIRHISGLREFLPYADEFSERTIHFVGPDRYWIRLSGQGRSASDTNNREFFDRVKKAPELKQLEGF